MELAKIGFLDRLLHLDRSRSLSAGGLLELS